MGNGATGEFGYGVDAATDVFGRGAQSLSSLGSRVRPFVMGPPQSPEIGHGGLYYQPTGFFQSAAFTAGFGETPRTATSMEYGSAVAGDTGERLGLGMAAAGTTLGGLALGSNLGLGRMFGAAGSAGGAAVGSMFGGTGAAMGARVGGLAASWVAAPMAGLAVAQGVMEGVQDRLVNQSLLDAESFRFVGAGSDMASARTGSGMSHKARAEAAEFIREQDIGDSFFGDEDMREILQSGMRKGMFTGASDMEQFKKRFKEITGNVKDLMKVLNVSLEEGLSTIQELRQSGIDVSKSREITMMAEATGKVAGRTGSEMVTMGLQGAEMFRGTGISTEIGMQANMSNLAAVRAGRDAGIITQQALTHLGGETGAAQFLTKSGIGFGQSEMGRGYAMAFIDPKTGGFDQDKYQKMIESGDAMDIVKVTDMAAKNMSTPGDIVRFQANQEQVMSDMGKMFGGKGLQMGTLSMAAGMAKMLQEMDSSIGGADALKHVMKTTFGLSGPQANLYTDMVTGRNMSWSASQKGTQKAAEDQQSIENEKRGVFYQAQEKVEDWMSNIFDFTARPITEQINKGQEWLKNWREENAGVTTGDTSNVNVGALTTMKTGKAAGPKLMDLSTYGSKFGMTTSVGEETLSDIKSGLFGSKAKDYIKTITPESADENAMMAEKRSKRRAEFDRIKSENKKAGKETAGNFLSWLKEKATETGEDLGLIQFTDEEKLEWATQKALADAGEDLVVLDDHRDASNAGAGTRAYAGTVGPTKHTKTVASLTGMQHMLKIAENFDVSLPKARAIAAGQNNTWGGTLDHHVFGDETGIGALTRHLVEGTITGAESMPEVVEKLTGASAEKATQEQVAAVTLALDAMNMGGIAEDSRDKFSKYRSTTEALTAKTIKNAQGQIAAGEETIEGIVDFKMSSSVAAKASQIASYEEKRAANEKMVQEMETDGADPAAISKAKSLGEGYEKKIHVLTGELHSLHKKGADRDEYEDRSREVGELIGHIEAGDLKKVQGEMGDAAAVMQQAKAKMATSQIGQAIMVSLRDEGLGRDEVRGMLGGLTALTTVEGLKGSTIPRQIAETPVGKMLADQKSALISLEKAVTPDDQRKIMRKHVGKDVLSGEEMGKIVGKLQDPETKHEGMQDYLEKSVVGEYKKDKFVSAVGGAGDLEKESGREFLANQTKINAQLLKGLQGVADKLGL